MIGSIDRGLIDGDGCIILEIPGEDLEEILLLRGIPVSDHNKKVLLDQIYDEVWMQIDWFSNAPHDAICEDALEDFDLTGEEVV